jgi:hypothetical protein
MLSWISPHSDTSLQTKITRSDYVTTSEPEFGNLLKVPKHEIFDRSDFPDFYTIKSLCVGDFGIKIKKFLQIFRSSFSGAKFLTRMLSLFLRRFFF